MISIRLHPIPLLAAALLLLTGCSSSKPPTFKVTGVQLREQNERASEFLFQIEAANPNGREVPLFEANYTLSIDGREVFRAIRTPETTLRRYGVQRFTLPVVIPAEDMPVSLQIPYNLSGTITYLMPGALAEILFDREIRRPKAAISDSGTLDLTTALLPHPLTETPDPHTPNALASTPHTPHSHPAKPLAHALSGASAPSTTGGTTGGLDSTP
ncbi:MAG: LEA type 2 family protein [Phycisphaeraceae bacterium]|nr:LEA type 2 family protein [Phycisphaeraceae bacterium]